MLALLLSAIDDPNDKLKLENIYIKYYQMMFKMAMKRLGDVHYAEDAVSNAFMRIALSIKRVETDNEDRLTAFVCTLVKNECIRIFPEKNRSDKLIDIEEIRSLRSQDDISSEIEEKEEYEKALFGISRLPEEYTVALRLYLVFGFSYGEIAEITDSKLGTVKSRIKRGIEKMRSFLKETKK